MSIRLYVGNLPKEFERQELEAVFSEFGDSASTKVITDRKTGKCRGFGFVTVKTEEEADQLIEKFNGSMFKETELKIERAQPRTKGKEDEMEPSSSAPAPTINRRAKGGSTGNSGKAVAGRKAVVTEDPESIQPDPRWAQELEKLKQLLQTANP
ncbi:MAG: RNA-binding protein [Drouetiella hepatica Uher 2000/2452]|jgi:RNA recognition motif-containing protein|uniref:RNA-binding protein n=1 Tax=Drouetiella hepatica Uher 2000/2452 TaxID=904376 RepID=A0A951Q7X8_9CYAN|nr:RNA-binding protein [Drouetiella hepatica Uher 2000/2452]